MVRSLVWSSRSGPVFKILVSGFRVQIKKKMKMQWRNIQKIFIKRSIFYVLLKAIILVKTILFISSLYLWFISIIGHLLLLNSLHRSHCLIQCLCMDIYIHTSWKYYAFLKIFNFLMFFITRELKSDKT